jgi:polysaccharide biosynthesis protein PslH
MNVLQICTKSPYPAKDGGALAITAIAEGLTELHHQVTILAANTPKHKSAIEDLPLGCQGLNLKTIPINTNIKFWRLLLNLLMSKKPYIVTRFYNSEFKQGLKEILETGDFDIVQLEGPHMGVYIPIIRKCTNAPIILRAHNVEHLIWEELTRNQTSFLKKCYLKNLAKRLKQFEKDVINKVDGLFSITRTDADKFMLFTNPRRIHVAPYGISMSKYIPTSQNEPGSLFFIGALDWMPNQEGLVWFLEKVWPLIQQKFNNVRFHIAGRNTPDWLISKISEVAADFHGEVDDSIAFMNSYQVMIVPLFSGSGIRVKIIEGMALEKAIVSTSKGVAGINIFDQQEILIADNPNDFIDKVICLLSDKSLQKRIGEVARAFVVKEFDNLAIAKKIESIYFNCHNNN